MRTQQAFYSIAIIFIIFWILYIGKKLLIPFLLAFFAWYLINVLANIFQNPPKLKIKPPVILSYILAVISILGIAYFLVHLITLNIAQIAKLAPEYQHNINQILEKAFALTGIQEPPAMQSLIKNLKLGNLISQFALALTNITGNMSMVLIYLIFIFLEQKSFHPKLKSLLVQTDSLTELDNLLLRIDSDIRKYLGIKTFTSALTGIISYIWMKSIGLDFAEFWAIMIFVLNYIPTIGSIVATLFPISLSLVQFTNYTPTAILAFGLGLTQFLIGNILDPRLLGNTLNLSPLAILVSLALWGAIWGPIGMILCVPITAILVIILSHFDKTVGFAILLSKNGNFTRA